MLSAIIRSRRRNSSWCLSSSSLKRTSASSATWSPSQCSRASSSTLALMNRSDQAEDVGVGAALDLAQQPRSAALEELEPADHREAVGKELTGVVEVASPDDVLVDVPADLPGVLETPAVAAIDGGGGIHGCLHCASFW